ncbi:hypothetical protein B0H21DRAFT_823409 [Amylocystis lapponica]|nr:hypothetical protein B0H21DRAFT_823409 [Amylocystis lapponica]
MDYLADGQTAGEITAFATSYIDEDSDFEDEEYTVAAANEETIEEVANEEHTDVAELGTEKHIEPVKDEECTEAVQDEATECKVQTPISEASSEITSPSSQWLDMQIEVLDSLPSEDNLQMMSEENMDQSTDAELAIGCPDSQTSQGKVEVSQPLDSCLGFDTYIVTGVASTTWEAFLFYTYTGTVTFAPLKSGGEVARRSFLDACRLDNPDRPVPCSCKSMYRLADEIGLDVLKVLALDHLRSQLSAESILAEIFSSFTSRYEEVKKIELHALTNFWHDLNGKPVSTEIFARIASGIYPHASWILEQWFQKLAPPAK